MSLDRTDCGILRSLQNNARISNKELAEENDISPSTCLERVRRLCSTGVIKGFRAEVDPKSVGIGVQALIAIRVEQQSTATFEEIRDSLLRIPEVIGIYVLAGSQDHLLHVAVRDVDHLRTLIWDAFMSRGEIAHVETSLIFESSRANSLPIYNEA